MACCFGESESLDREQNIPKVVENPDRINAFLRLLMREGARGQKVTKSGSRDHKVFVIDRNLTKLSYAPTSKKKDNSIALRNVWEIRVGDDASEGLKKTKIKEGEDYAFAVVMKDGRTMSIIVDTEAEHELFVQSLAFVVRTRRAVMDDDPHRIRLMELWMQADQNGDKRLSLTELSTILDAMNVNIDHSTLKKRFTDADEDGSGTLDFTEFSNFYNDLTTRLELEPLFNLYSTNFVMDAEQFKDFVLDVQGEEIPLEVAHRILKMSIGGKTHTAANAPAAIGFPEFVRFLLNPKRNGWGNPQQMNSIDESEMTHPLHHYFIATSHNSYLSGDQLQSDSRTEMYRMALRSGCRCVEVDCWDGAGGEPVVYHGYTRTSKIKFRDVVEAVNETAFETSDFPVILSLEVHTNKEQSNIMAADIRQVFGSKLYTNVEFEKDQAGGLDMWNPLALKNKILVKWKLTDDGYDDEKECDNEEVNKEKKKVGEVKKVKDHGDLGRTVLVAAHKTKSWGDDCPGINYIESINENKTENFAAKHPEDFRRSNTKMMHRVYPKGTRVDSSNYNPCRGWEHGAQCVALNYQTWDEWMRVNDAKFLRNNRCGFILKPEYLRDASIPRPDAVWTLRVNVILAAQLPKPDNDDKGEIIDPYVRLMIRGGAKDEEANPARETKVIDDNGFSPFWNETFDFTLTDLDTAMLTVRVLDKDLNADDEIGEGTMAIRCLRQGYRSVMLRDTIGGRELDHATLLCHFSLFQSEEDAPAEITETAPFGQASTTEEPVKEGNEEMKERPTGTENEAVEEKKDE